MEKLTVKEILALAKFDPNDLPEDVRSAFHKLLKNYEDTLGRVTYEKD